MLLYKIRLPLIILLMMLIGSCGFSPVYGKNSKTFLAKSSITNLDIKVGRTQIDHIFKTTLEDIINPMHEHNISHYTLTADITSSSSFLAILQNSNITSYSVTLSIKYSLTDNNTKKVIHASTITRQANFNRSLSEYSTFVSEQEAKENVAKSLAQDLSVIVTSAVMGQENKPSSLKINESSNK